MATTYTKSQNTDPTRATYGQSSQGVADLQTYLNSKGANLKVDSLYGDMTRKAVEKYGLPPLNVSPTSSEVQGIGTITGAGLKPTPKIDIPTPYYASPSNLPPQNFGADALKAFDLTETETAAKKSEQDVTANLLKAIGGLSGQDQALADAQKEQGLPQLKQELQTLNSQILKKQAELAQDDVRLVANMRAEERRDTLLPFAQSAQNKLAGDAQIVRALKSSEIGVLNASVLAKQGDIALAKETATEAVNLKYAPFKDAIAIGKAQLEAIKPFLDDAEKKQAKALDLKANLALKEIDKVSDFQKTILNNAISSNAPASVINAINRATTIEEVSTAGKGYLQSASDKLELAIKGKQLAKLTQELSKNSDAGELVKIGGKEYIRYKDGTISEPVLPEAKDTGAVISRLDNKLKTLTNLLKPSVGLATSAGSLRGAPIPFVAKNAINNWRADAINVIQKLTVDELGRVKSDGVTFGALSNGERQAVGDAATALGSASIRDKDGNPTGRFKMSEKKVIQEFKKIYDGYALDFERRSGVPYEIYLQNPDAVKFKIADDFIDSASSVLEANNYGNYSLN